ncbi:MAG TPA: diphthamide synthesis protein [Candidatus Paceibacterota bacterium]|nr:diphthamide synthesis protein [Candidatus Paceibacterota bacterium]
MYNLELDKIVKEIKKLKAKRVLIQLPDGLKPNAEQIVDYIQKSTNSKVQVFVWLGTCFGGCDIPSNLNIINIDLIVQFGHNKFDKESW